MRATLTTKPQPWIVGPARYDGSILICLSDLALEAAATLNASEDQRTTLKSALETAQCE
jgi:hypothetical protein